MRKFNYISTLFAAALMVSCTAEDYYNTENGAAYREKYAQDMKNEFRQNFEETFGKISSTQSWDFSNMATRAVTRAGEGITVTPVAGMDFGVSNSLTTTGIKSTFSKNIALQQHITKKLPDGKTQSGEEAILTAPANSFTIYPLSAQGSYTYDMYVKIGDEAEVKVFSKDWSDAGKPYFHGMGTERSLMRVTQTASMPGVTVEAPVGTPIQIYLKNIKSDRKKVTDNALGTVSGNAIILDCNVRPEGLDESIMPEDAVIKFVGIEDNPTLGDHDYNDLVLMIVGNPYTPQPIVIEDDYYTEDVNPISKRYMIEDLGSTDDFDYNDVVVDVMSSMKQRYHVVKTNGVITSREKDGEPYPAGTKAIIRALGGTLDLNLTIGRTTWNKKTATANPFAMWNTGQPTSAKDVSGHVIYEDGGSIDFYTEGYEFDVEGWDPDDNNIIVEVFPNRANSSNPNVAEGTGSTPWTIINKFPAAGETPFIIAVPLNEKWMVERNEFTRLKNLMGR